MNLAALFESGPQRRPRPPVAIELERSLPAWLLRGLSAAVIVIGIVPVTNDVVVPLLAAAVLMVLPYPGTVAGLLALAAVWVWGQPPDLLTCAVLVLVLHLVAVLTRLTAPLPPTGRVELRLLLRAFAAFAVIQLITQAMVGLSFAAMDGLPTFSWFAVLAVVGIAGALLAGARWAGRHTQ